MEKVVPKYATASDTVCNFFESIADIYVTVYFSDNISTAQKMKFSIKDFFSKYDQIRRKLRIWSHLLKKSLMESFIFRAVKFALYQLQSRQNQKNSEQ